MSAANCFERMVRRLCLRFGHLLIPVAVAERLESDEKSYIATKRKQVCDFERGYFNGLSDHAGKTAETLRRYQPNR